MHCFRTGVLPVRLFPDCLSHMIVFLLLIPVSEPSPAIPAVSDVIPGSQEGFPDISPAPGIFRCTGPVPCRNSVRKLSRNIVPVSLRGIKG